MIGDFPLAHNFTQILNFIALILNFIATRRRRSSEKGKLEAKSMTSIKWLIRLQVSSQLRYENCYPLKRPLAIYHAICVYYGSMRRVCQKLRLYMPFLYCVIELSKSRHV